MAGVGDWEVGEFQSGGGSLAQRVKLHSALVVIHAAYGAYFVIAKACLSGGVDPLIFAVYRDAIGCAVLFFYAAIFERHHWQKMSLRIAGLILLMAFVGVYLLQGLFLIGLQYTDVIFASIMMNTIPIWTFLIAVMMRIEMIHYKRRDGQAKILGIVVCVIGATLITVYKGPAVFGDSNPSPISGLQKQPISGFSAAIQNWGLDEWHFGALCLLFSCFSASAFVNLQFVALSKFPAPFTLMSGSTFGGAIMFIASALLTFKDSSPWFLPPGPDLIAVLYAGIIASGMTLFLQCYATQHGGPVLVGAYAPLQPVFTTVFSFIFLGETLFFGR